MKIAILIPYVRPELMERAFKAAQDNAGILPKHFKVIAREDKNKIGHTKFFQKMVEETESDLVAFIADDCIPHKNYLKNALKVMKKFKDGWGVVGFNDGTNRLFATQWIADRRMLDILGGEFLHTGYKHCCCDVELYERAEAHGRYIIAKSAFVEHDHPMLTGDKKKFDEDPIYSTVYSPEYLEHDRSLLNRRRLSGWPTS